jgi:hypothetical protein
MLDAFVVNRGKYTEGEVLGEWLKIPATRDVVKRLLARIGVDGVLYESYFITEYTPGVKGLGNLSEYENIDELNYLTALIADMDEWDREKFEAAAVEGTHSNNAKDLINLTQNLDCYEYFPNVTNCEELGRYLLDELEWEEVKLPKWAEDYFDYEEYGDTFSINEGGDFMKGGGYISRNDVDFEEYYTGRDDIPEEHRIFAYPDPPEKMPFKQQFAMYGAMMPSAPTADRPPPVIDER